jgi:hypothetical protein
LEARNILYSVTLRETRGQIRLRGRERENHSPTVDWDGVVKGVRIELDGEKLADEHPCSPGTKKFSFDARSPEVYEAEVSAGMLSSLKDLVDGKPAQRSDAYA